MHEENYAALAIEIIKQTLKDAKHKKYLHIKILAFLGSDWFDALTSWMPETTPEKIKEKIKKEIDIIQSENRRRCK